MTKKYEYTCPKCGAIALVWVDDITLNDEVVGQRTEVRCFSCNYKKVTYKAVPTAVVMCKDCTYGEQDEEGWWFCRDFGSNMGHEDGSGFCSDAERRSNGLHQT